MDWIGWINWSDAVVVLIIAVFGIIGLINGFVYSAFKIASFFAAIFVSIKFYPTVAEMLTKFGVYANIKASILKNLLLQKNILIPGSNGQAEQAAADTLIDKLPLPEFFKGTLLKQLPDPSKLIDIPTIFDTISGELSRVFINIISLILLYILIRIGLVFLRFILQGLAKLPVFKQIDKTGGFAFGAVEGLLTVYIVTAILMLFNASPQFRGIFETIDDSVIAKFFYENNFIVDLMFPSGG